MMGAMMALAAGWEDTVKRKLVEKMKRIEVHAYRTPTRDNPDCEWSLGIMNLTKSEASMISTFAHSVRGTTEPRQLAREVDRVNGLGLKPLTFKCRNGHSLVSATSLCYECERDGTLVVEPAAEREPGNRFSGLDLPPTIKDAE
jgi:hypothetical protein